MIEELVYGLKEAGVFHDGKMVRALNGDMFGVGNGADNERSMLFGYQIVLGVYDQHGEIKIVEVVGINSDIVKHKGHFCRSQSCSFDDIPERLVQLIAETDFIKNGFAKAFTNRFPLIKTNLSINSGAILARYMAMLAPSENPTMLTLSKGFWFMKRMISIAMVFMVKLPSPIDFCRVLLSQWRKLYSLR